MPEVAGTAPVSPNVSHMRGAKNLGRRKPQKRHWRDLASSFFPEHQEFTSSTDEEYGVYNLFFQLRDQLVEAISHEEVKTATTILDFAGQCLENRLASDGEDISVAAGVALFEHIFDDLPAKRWPDVLSAMTHTVFLACRPYAKNWMEPKAFWKLDKAAKKYYG